MKALALKECPERGKEVPRGLRGVMKSQGGLRGGERLVWGLEIHRED